MGLVWESGGTPPIRSPGPTGLSKATRAAAMHLPEMVTPLPSLRDSTNSTTLERMRNTLRGASMVAERGGRGLQH